MGFENYMVCCIRWQSHRLACACVYIQRILWLSRERYAMIPRTLILLLAIALAAALLLGCQDWDGLDRSGFEATATASVWTEAARRAAEVTPVAAEMSR
jgi:hypothetical protein